MKRFIYIVGFVLCVCTYKIFTMDEKTPLLAKRKIVKEDKVTRVIMWATILLKKMQCSNVARTLCLDIEQCKTKKQKNKVIQDFVERHEPIITRLKENYVLMDPYGNILNQPPPHPLEPTIMLFKKYLGKIK